MRPDLRVVPEAARVAETTAGGPPRCPPAVAQYGQLAHLDAYVPFPGLHCSTIAPGSHGHYSRSALVFLLRAGVTDLDRALIRELAVVLVLVPAGSSRSQADNVSLSFAPWTVAAFGDTYPGLQKTAGSTLFKDHV